ncbi:MAG: thylakoid membrane photosystem I accumulation factor [Coleofasciculaceae cyanobacterium]
MSLHSSKFPIKITTTLFKGQRLVSLCLLSLVVVFISLLVFNTPPALAGLNDDRYDGNIFALYSGNGSLVPPRMTLAETLPRNKPALLVFYVEDSSDCKKFSTVISQLQAPYGRAASFIPINIDSIPSKSSYKPIEPGYYYEGLVPQTVLIDQKGKVVLNEMGQVSYEKVDDVFREVFDLLPRSESVELKRRSFNEINSELSEE